MYGTLPYVKKTTVYLPEALKAKLERIAAERQVSEAQLVRAALDEYTRTTARPRPRLPLFDSIGDPTLAERVDEILADGFGGDHE
jgi:Ribbon-helix-helix protein, copG family